jgi:hypothetical protein
LCYYDCFDSFSNCYFNDSIFEFFWMKITLLKYKRPVETWLNKTRFSIICPVKKVSLFLHNWNTYWMPSYRLQSASVLRRFYLGLPLLEAIDLKIDLHKGGNYHNPTSQTILNYLFACNTLLICYLSLNFLDFVSYQSINHGIFYAFYGSAFFFSFWRINRWIPAGDTKCNAVGEYWVV